MNSFFSHYEYGKKKWFFISMVLFVYAVLICTRAPQIIITGRFWAEEGKVFFYNAVVMPPLKALLNSYGGYLNLVANAATLLAYKTTSIAYAPYVTITIGLIFQLLPPFLLLTAKDEWLRPPLVRMSAVALLLFIPSSSEVWLQVLHCQFELALSSALILSMDTTSGAMGGLRLFVLFLAPLSGPGSIIFVAPFFLRLLTDRNRARLFQFMAITSGAALQLAFFYHTDGGRGGEHWFQPALAAVFCREPLQVFGGLTGETAKIILHVQQSFDKNSFGLVWPQLATIFFFGLLLCISLLFKKSRVCFWLLLANATFTGAALFGSIGGAIFQINMYAGERYVFVGQSLLALTVLAMFVTSSAVIRRFTPLVVLWMLAVGMHSYWHPMFNRTGDAWRPEVHKWEANHSYPMKTWPGNWVVNLP